MKKITLVLLFLSSNMFSQVELVTNFSWAYPTKVNNKIVFSRSTPEYGSELWVSDGTTEGTMLLKDIIAGPTSSTPYLFTLLDDVVYFTVNTHQIWRTDGTPSGTYMMVNNNQITNPGGFVKTKDFIFFYEGVSNYNNCCHTLWRMNTNPNSENIVTPSANIVDAKDLYVFDYNNNIILFNAKIGYSNNSWAIWRTNGGVSLEVKKDISIGSGKVFGSELYFGGFSMDYGYELWKTDGTTPNTGLIKDINTDPYIYNGSYPSDFVKIGATIYFSAKDLTHGIELWKTNGSEVSTEMVKDIFPGNNTNSWQPDSLTEFRGELYFVANDGSGYQVWKSDGTSSGSVKVTNIPNSYIYSANFFINNGEIFFDYYTPENGIELWKLDVNNNTTMISDIALGSANSNPGNFFEFNGEVYFNATNNGFYTGYGTYKVSSQNLKVNNPSKTNFMYPNPTSGILNLSSQNQYDITINDLLGKQVGQFKNQKTIDISNLKAGIYLLKATDIQTNTTSTHKIIKE